MQLAIREAGTADGEAIAALYNPYIVDGVATFETVAVDGAEIARRIDGVAAAGLPWLVAESGDGRLLGYAYATPWRARAAYRHSVESTVYLAPDTTGRGLGRRLYGALLEALATRPVRAVIGGIALPNDASVALHEALGFEPVARFREVGLKHGRWIDVGYWQRLLRAVDDHAFSPPAPPPPP